MRSYVLVCITVLAGHFAYGQTVVSPNFGLKTPSTAEIVKVDFNAGSTVVWMTIMSDINNAYFCIDRNTFMITPSGSRLKLRDVKGLPNCPATYRFKRPGEKVSFSLTFPPSGQLPWFSVVEECSGGCLTFRGVVTDADLNAKLNEAYKLTETGQSMAAYRIFEEIIAQTDSLNLGIEGAVYSGLILLDRGMGRSETARKWYDRMMTSDTPDLAFYLDNLRRQGVTY